MPCSPRGSRSRSKAKRSGQSLTAKTLLPGSSGKGGRNAEPESGSSVNLHHSGGSSFSKTSAAVTSAKFRREKPSKQPNESKLMEKVRFSEHIFSLQHMRELNPVSPREGAAGSAVRRAGCSPCDHGHHRQAKAKQEGCRSARGSRRQPKSLPACLRDFSLGASL